MIIGLCFATLHYNYQLHEQKLALTAIFYTSKSSVLKKHVLNEKKTHVSRAYYMIDSATRDRERERKVL